MRAESVTTFGSRGRRSSLALIFLCISLALAGCGSDGGETTPSDTGGMTEADSGTDAGTSDDDGGNQTGGSLEVGTHPPNDNQAESFVSLEDGAAVPFYFGVQGSWMVVLAFRTQGMFEETFDVIGEISVDGNQIGDVWLADQETFAGAGGWDYYFNFFLPIDGEPPDPGTDVHILMRVEDMSGNEAVREYDVTAGEANGP